MNTKETLIVNTSSDKQLNTGKRINYLVLMITLVLCSPLQGCHDNNDGNAAEANVLEESAEENAGMELEQTKFATAHSHS